MNWPNEDSHYAGFVLGAVVAAVVVAVLAVFWPESLTTTVYWCTGTGVVTFGLIWMVTW